MDLRARSTNYGTNSAHFCGTLIWNQLRSSIKTSKSIVEFQFNFKQYGMSLLYVENRFFYHSSNIFRRWNVMFVIWFLLAFARIAST